MPGDSASTTSYKTRTSSQVTSASTKQKLAQLEKDFETEKARRIQAEELI